MEIESVPLNIRQAAEEVLDCVCAKADEQRVELVCDIAGPQLSDGHVLSDPGRFRQVLLNFVGTCRAYYLCLGLMLSSHAQYHDAML